MQDKVEVFFSYAHEDEQLALELARQLGILQLQGLITVWHRQKIAPLPNFESPDCNKLKELANNVRKSYSIIRGYEDIIRISDDPGGKAQALQSIERQGILARHFLNEYLKLADQMGIRVPPDLIQISSYFGDMEYRAIS